MYEMDQKKLTMNKENRKLDWNIELSYLDFGKNMMIVFMFEEL